ncbi:hypothetical protein ACFL52_03695, partial [Candidatus Margulisiibacteriota bacterium]
MRKNIILMILFTLHCSLLTSAWAAGQGGQLFDTLKSGVGARALGMGGAYTAISDNADAPFWNPAGLASIAKSEITTSQTRMSTDADHYYLSFVSPLKKGSFGLSWIQVGTGNLLHTASQVDSYNEVQTLGTFSYYSNAMLLSYGVNLTNKVAAGITAKYLSAAMEVSADGKASGYSITPGVLLKASERFTLGLKVD